MKKLSIAVFPALLLAGCTIPTGPVEVTRFNRVAEGIEYQGGSYAIELPEGQKLALSPYADAIKREMDALGYSDQWSGFNQYTVSFTVKAMERIAERGSPVSVGVGGSTGGYRSGIGMGVGINLGGGRQERVLTELFVKITQFPDNTVVWEGTARQEAGKKSQDAHPANAASRLAAALFADFPGQNGETITVK